MVLEPRLEETQLPRTVAHRISIPTLSVVVVALAALAVGVAVSSGSGREDDQLAADTEPYVLEQAAAFPNETFTVTAFRKSGMDCVEAASAITGGYCNPGQYDSVADGTAPGLFGAVGNGARYLWFGAVSPDIEEFVLDLRSGGSRVIKPVPAKTAGTSLPVAAVYVADARDVTSAIALRSDGRRVDIMDFFGPASVPPPPDGN